MDDTYAYRAELGDLDDRFVSSYGGPLLVVPRAHLEDWWGCCNERGEHVYEKEPTDYDRACAAGDFPFAIPLRGAPAAARWALVLEAPDATCFWPGEDGDLLLVRWCGADSAAALVSVALGVDESRWEETDVELEVPPGGLALFDSAMDGRQPERMDNGLVFAEAPPGRYAVDRIESIDAIVTGGPDGDEETMTQLLRLRALGR